MYGYRGKILSVDLGTEKITTMPLDEKLARQYIGGAGLACRILYDMIDSDTNPLGPENPLLFLTGPFCGTRVPTGSKASLCSRSPLTGLWLHSTFGGHLGADIKFAGYDGILITGASKTAKYLLVEDDKVSIQDASHLWGLDTEVTWNKLKEETGYNVAGIARIGIAGENLVKYASVIIDHHRAAGRGGLGAVFGSKKLKALVVKGTDRKVPVAQEEKLNDYLEALNERKQEDVTFNMYSEMGTAGFVDTATMMFGSMTAGYYQVSDFDAFNISGATVSETILVGKTACYRCPIGCGRVIEINEGQYATGKFSGPELEVTGTMGIQLMNDDVEALSFASKQLDLLGMDFITAGNVVAFAYYLYTEGMISSDDLDGLEPEWGETDTALKLLKKIATREGVGDLMAEGSIAFGEKFGKAHLAAQVNGLDLPQHDPRGFSGMAIGYMTSPRGACHMTADMYNIQMGVSDESIGVVSEDRFENAAVITARQQDFRAVTNSSVICNFYPILGDEMVDLFKMVVGWDYSLDELKLTGERIFTLMRLFNLKLGYDSSNERLPEIVMQSLEGPTEGFVPDTEAQLDAWYSFRDWDRTTGRPSKSKLELLNLETLSK
ncbi:MAG: aldehyde ferredoxin oxidoreductase [Candidatus Lokiarchaeota archaeon]|nr:aldehyde ferredoxin oxidoreductase [Candidatus Lokiarchaeota archaeon]